MRKAIVLFAFLLTVKNLAAQPAPPDLNRYKTTEKKLQAWLEYCDLYFATHTLAGEGRELVRISKQGFNWCPPGDVRFRGEFADLIANGFERAHMPDSAMYYYELTEKFAAQTPNSFLTARALSRLNMLYYRSGKFKLQKSLIDRATQLLDTTKNITVKVLVSGSISEYFLLNANYEQAIVYQLKNIDYQREDMKTNPKAVIDNIGIKYIQVGNTYSAMDQEEKAIEYFRYADSYLPKYREGRINLYAQFVNSYLILDKPDSAQVYYRKLYGMMVSGDSAFVELSYAEMVFADYWIRKKQLKEAGAYAGKAARFAEKSGDRNVIIDSKSTLANLAFERKDYDAAVRLLEQITTAEAYQFSRESYAQNCLKLAECYRATGRWQQAGLYYGKYIPLKDSLYTEASKKSLVDAEAKYQNKEKQQQIEAQHTELAYARKQTLWLIAGLSLSGLVALLLVVIYRNKKRTADVLDSKNQVLATLNNELEEANRTKAKLFGIISHDLRSPISQVYQFLKLQQMAPDKLDAEQRNVLSDKIQSATGSLLETMEDLLLWSKTQMSQFNVDMQPVDIYDIISESLRLLQLNIDAKGLEVITTGSERVTVESDPYFLQVIVRNLLQNAIKAAPPKGSIRISFSENTLSVCNDGPYFSQKDYEAAIASEDSGKSLSGLGLRLIDELGRKISARIFFADTGGTGTCVHLVIKGQQV